MLSLQTRECSEESTDQRNINHSRCKQQLLHIQISPVHAVIRVPSYSSETRSVWQGGEPGKADALVPHQATFTGQATPVPAAARVAHDGSSCLLVWKIALGE